MATPTLATAGGRRFTAGYPGQQASNLPSQVVSRTNSSATAIEFGVVVAKDAASPFGVKPWAADTDLIAGVVVRDVLMPASTAGVVNYAQYASVPIMEDGEIFVQVAEAVRKDDQAIIITAGGTGNTVAGALGGSKGGVAGSGRVDFPGATYLEDIAQGAVGRLRVKSTGGRRTTT